MAFAALSALLVALSAVPLYTIVKQEYVPSDVDEAELEQTVEILKAAAAFFAREYDPPPTRSAGSSPSSGTGSESYRSAGH